MTRSAPTASTTPRVLILSDYHEDGEVTHEDDTTLTTCCLPFVFPRGNRNLIPSQQPIQIQRISSVRTKGIDVYDDEETEIDDEYDGAFKFISNFGKSYQKFLEDMNKLSRTFGEILFANASQQQQYDE